jgi:hypothetical protein
MRVIKGIYHINIAFAVCCVCENTGIGKIFLVDYICNVIAVLCALSALHVGVADTFHYHSRSLQCLGCISVRLPSPQ